MRQLLFVFIYLTLLPTVLVSPFVGMIAYKWLEYMPPGQVYYAFAIPEQTSFVMAAAALGAWVIVDKKRVPHPLWLFGLLVAYFLWIQVTTYFAVQPDAAYIKWDRTTKVLLVSIVLSIMLTSRMRLESFVWTLALSIGFFACSGAVKTILSGGGGETVVGAPTTFISDRVGFAPVLCLMIPLVWWLARHDTLFARFKWRDWAIRGLLACYALAIIGTQARTGIVAGAAVFGMFVLQSKRKVPTLLIGLIFVIVLLMLAPEAWWARFDAIETYEQDASATSRIDAWRWAYRFAVEHPIFGGGFRVFVLNLRPNGDWLEAHNIFFEVMAEHGFVGLAIFVGLLVGVWFNAGRTRRLAQGNPDLAWAADFATALRISIFAYCVGGMFAAAASFSIPFDLVALSIGLRGVVMRARATIPRATVAAKTPPALPIPAPLWPGPRPAGAPKTA
jgi:putative inorganic carbon (hco3(-)) transporter